METNVILTKLYEKIEGMVLDISHIKEVQARNGVVIENTNEQAKKTNGRVSNLEDSSITLAKVQADQAHLISKLHGAFNSHQQWIEQEILKSKEFANRQINLVEERVKKIETIETDSEQAKRSWVLDVSKHAITAIITLIGAWLTIKK